MGTWGHNILDNDTAADVYADYVALYEEGKEPKAILAKMLKHWRNVTDADDEDEWNQFWLAVARAQWDYGEVAADVRERVREIVTSGSDLKFWQDDEEPADVARRKRTLTAFLKKIQTANPRPRKQGKVVRRKTIFEPGDCLAIRLSDGEWGAALVLEPSPPKSKKARQDSEDVNLIGLLDYKSPTKPTLAAFSRRNWVLGHLPPPWSREPAVVNVGAVGFKKYKANFEVVGSVTLRPEDPQESQTYATWNFGETVVRLRQRGHRRRAAGDRS